MGSIDVLRASPAFADLEEESLQAIARLATAQSYAAGATIFSEGQIADRIYVLVKGWVGMRATGPRGDDVLLDTIREPGEVFGWSGLVAPRLYTSTAMAMDGVEAVSIGADQLRALLDKDCTAGYIVMTRLAEVIAARLRNTRSQLAGLGSGGSPITHG